MVSLSNHAVPLNGFTMLLRRPEIDAVAAGLGPSVPSQPVEPSALAEALRRLPVADRAPTWEMAVRHFGHGKALAQAAGEIGLDEIHAGDLLQSFTRSLTRAPPPEPG